MTAPILYCGDTNLDGAASYLAGMMTHFGWSFDYVPSHVPMTRELIERPHSLLILSDYPAMQFGGDLQEIALKQVTSGMGLLMIGGWESFRGLGGDWDVAPIARALPVEINREDDRINFSSPTVLFPSQYFDWPEANRIQPADESDNLNEITESIIGGLPWGGSLPTTGGLNQVNFKRSGMCYPILYARTFSLKWNRELTNWQACEEAIYPALIAGSHELGRTAAFMSDVAPHWVGGFVDWGSERVKAQAAGASGIEVGSDYARFWKQLLSWVGRLD